MQGPHLQLKHDAGKFTTLLDTHVANADARQALADDLFDVLSCYKGKEQHPDSIHEASDILSQHHWDQNPSNQSKPNSDSCNSNLNYRSLRNNNRNNQNRDQNHPRSNNDNINESRTDSSNPLAPSFAQQGRCHSSGQSQPHSQAICQACGKMGHIHPDCDKNIP